MAAINFSTVSIRLPDFCSGSGKKHRSSTTEKPEIELEFIAPKAESDGKYPVDRAKAIGGDKLLRSIMLDNKLEQYGAYGKVMNCGGGGSCGTCIVEVNINIYISIILLKCFIYSDMFSMDNLCFTAAFPRSFTFPETLPNSILSFSMSAFLILVFPFSCYTMDIILAHWIGRSNWNLKSMPRSTKDKDNLQLFF